MPITHLLLVVEVWDDKPTYRKLWAGNLLVWSDLTLDPSFKEGLIHRQNHRKYETWRHNWLKMGTCDKGFPLIDIL